MSYFRNRISGSYQGLNRIISGMPLRNLGEFYDKQAAQFDYVIKGDDLQAVGLRKNLHKILERKGIKGLAVNNALNGTVEVSLRTGGRKKAEEALEMLRGKIKSDFDSDITIRRRSTPSKHRRVNLNLNHLQDMNLHGNLQYIRSKLYSPGKASLMSMEEHMNDLIERYRLKRTDNGLRGYVPERAYRQLKGMEPMYSYFREDQFLRDYDEAFKIQQYNLSRDLI